MDLKELNVAKDELPPQDRIVMAAITCIERDGIEATGIREIAREAGVNSAAINYYFRSKDNLLALALERTLEQAFGEVLKDLERLMAEGRPAQEALVEVLEEYLVHVARYPRIAYAHMREALVNQRYDTPAVKQLNAFLAELAGRLAPALPHLSDAELRIALSQVWAVLMMQSIAPQLFTPFSRVDLDQPKHRRAFVKLLLERLVAPSPKPSRR